MTSKSRSTNPTTTAEKRADQFYRARVRQLLVQAFDLDDQEMVRQDRVWDEWLGALKEVQTAHPVRTHGVREESAPLRALLYENEVRDSFKARVVAVLLAPTIAKSPFRYSGAHPQWSSTRGYVTAWLDPFYKDPLIERVRDFSGRLRQFFWDLLEINLEFAGWQKQSQSRKLFSVREGGDALSDSDRNIDYNKLILKGLEMLFEGSEQTERLWKLYYLTVPDAPSPLWSPNTDYYSSFRALLAAPVAEGWKVRADQLERQMVIKQRSLQNRLAALRLYVYEIERALQDTAQASIDLLASQVEWALQQLNGEKVPLFGYGSLGSVMILLRHGGYSAILHQVIRNLVLCQRPGYPFQVLPNTVNEVSLAFRDFGDADPELGSELERILREYQEQEERSRVTRFFERRAVGAMYK